MQCVGACILQRNAFWLLVGWLECPSWTVTFSCMHFCEDSFIATFQLPLAMLRFMYVCNTYMLLSLSLHFFLSIFLSLLLVVHPVFLLFISDPFSCSTFFLALLFFLSFFFIQLPPSLLLPSPPLPTPSQRTWAKFMTS